MAVKIKIVVEGPKGKVEKTIEVDENVKGRERIKLSGKVVSAFWEAFKKAVGEQ